MRPFDSIVLNQDLPEHHIKAGTRGVIVDKYERAMDVFIVEFFDKDGKTIDVVDVRAEQMTVTLADFFDGDSVALLGDVPAHHLQRGQVGVVKERVGGGVYEVEFADSDGKPYARATLHANLLMLLHWQPHEVQSSAL